MRKAYFLSILLAYMGANAATVDSHKAITALEYETAQLQIAGDTQMPGLADFLKTPAVSTANATPKEATWQPSVVTTKMLDGTDLFRYTYMYDHTGSDFGGFGPMVQLYEMWDANAQDYIQASRYKVVVDEAGRGIIYFLDIHNGTGWTNYYREVYAYNGQGWVMSRDQEYWQNDQWYGMLRWDNEYDDNGNLIKQVYQNRTADNPEWQPGSRFTWEYDENSYLIYTNQEAYSPTSGEYSSMVERYYTNDAAGRVLVMEQKQLNALVMRQSHVYNEAGYETEFTQEGYREEKGGWFGVYHNTYTYDDQDHFLTEVQQISTDSLPVESTTWRNVAKTEVEYGDKAATQTEYNGNRETGEWTPYTKVEVTYDDLGQEILAQNYSWNATTNEWIAGSKTTRTYDGIYMTEYKTTYNNPIGEEMVSAAYTWTYDDNGNGSVVDCTAKGGSDQISLPYNHMANNWVGKGDYYSYHAEATYINMTTDYIAPTAVSFTTDEATLTVGDSVRLAVEVLPENASNNEVHWTSDDETIARIDVDGQVFGLAEGTTTVRATTLEGRLEATASVTVTSASGMEAVSSATYVTCTGGQLTVHGDGIREVRVYATGGQLQAQSTTQFTFVTGTWPQGVYLVQVVQGGQSRMHKVTVR